MSLCRYVDVAKAAGVTCRCLVMSVTHEHAKHNEQVIVMTISLHLFTTFLLCFYLIIVPATVRKIVLEASAFLCLFRELSCFLSLIYLLMIMLFSSADLEAL